MVDPLSIFEAFPKSENGHKTDNHLGQVWTGKQSIHHARIKPEGRVLAKYVQSSEVSARNSDIDPVWRDSKGREL